MLRAELKTVLTSRHCPVRRSMSRVATAVGGIESPQGLGSPPERCHPSKRRGSKRCDDTTDSFWPIPAVQTQSGKWHVNSLGDHVRPADCPRHTRTPDHFDRNQQPGDKQHATTKARQETARQPRHQPGRSKSPHKPFHYQFPPFNPAKSRAKNMSYLRNLYKV